MAGGPRGLYELGQRGLGPLIWSAYKDTLTFKKASPAPMPTGLVVKPWRKTET